MPVSRRITAATGGALLLLCQSQSLMAEETRSPLSVDLGSGVSATFYGYIKADFIWDDGFDLGRSTSGIKNIGLPGVAAGEFDRQQLDETRIGIDIRGPNDLFSRFEGDFYGPNHNLRLRHAYVDWYGVMVGQNWTNFMSVENLADTVDFQGSGALPFARSPQLRYTYKGLANTAISASIEEDVGNSDDYAYTLAVRYGFDRGMVRASGLYRDASLTGGQVDGWGLNLSTVLDLWAGGKLKANVTTGSGISDFLGAGLTGNAVAIGGNSVGVNSGAITVSHQFNEELKVALTGSWLGEEIATGTDTEDLSTVHLSAFYKVRKDTTLMAEYFTGTRTQGDGQKFDTDRVQLAIKYAF